MAAASILSDFQKKALNLFKTTGLVKQFYLAGGTALSEYYLKHRKSEDLDFFTQDELPLAQIKRFTLSLQKIFPLDKIEYQHGFGLYTFFFYPKNEVAKYKIDFGQFPFGTIEPVKLIDGIRVESLFDIAADKAHTISIRPRMRDFIDLYLILQQNQDWEFYKLVEKGQEKFEVITDPIQLGENLLQVNHLTDMPIMLKKVDMRNVHKFFIEQAKKLTKRIF